MKTEGSWYIEGMQHTLRALTEQFDAVAASLDSACVELELILASPAISPERRESGMIALADAQACLLRCGVRTTPSAVTATLQPTL